MGSHERCVHLCKGVLSNFGVDAPPCKRLCDKHENSFFEMYNPCIQKCVDFSPDCDERCMTAAMLQPHILQDLWAPSPPPPT